MEQTTNYDQFKSITANREVNNSHVNRLVKAIAKKNLLHLNPILCNENLEVIDGQHRLEAAKILQLPIWYNMDSNVSEDDIASINSNSKNWSQIDYINYYTIKKKPGFDKLSSFLSEHPLIKTSTALSLLSADGFRDSKALYNGKVNVMNYPFAIKVAETLKFFRNYFEHSYDGKFILALSKLINHPDYNFERLKSQVDMQPRSLVRCIDKKQYFEMLLEIYNYKASKNRLSFTRDD